MMSQPQRDRLNPILRFAAAPALAGLLLASPAALFAAPSGVPVAPSAFLQDEDEDEGVLSAHDINLIRVYEVDIKSEPRVRIDRDVLEDFLEDPAFADRDGMPRGRDQIREFMRAEGWQQLKLFFDMRARDYYGEAEVQQEPAPLRAWESINGRYITQYFLRHFGNKDLGPDVELQYQGRPIEQIPLLGRGRDSSAIAYTNFYILSQVTVNGIPMIDRDRPMQSIMIQWGLPREDARYDAPEVEGWRPQFRSADADDARLAELLEWIESLQGINQGSRYGIEFIPAALRGDEDQ